MWKADPPPDSRRLVTLTITTPGINRTRIFPGVSESTANRLITHASDLNAYDSAYDPSAHVRKIITVEPYDPAHLARTAS